MKISLVLCTLGDRKRQLTRLIESLRHQQFKSFEIVLVDQNPPGHLDELLQTKREELAFKHVRSDRGLSIARNIGLLSATGEIIGFPDDDCWYYPETLQQITAFFQRNPKIDILLGRTVDEFGMPSLSPFRKESGGVNRDNIWNSGNSNTLFVRRNAVPVPGAFDEQIGVGARSRYQSGEESDFILNLIRDRARAVYLSDLTIGHDQVDDVDATRTLKRAWAYSLGFGYVLKKHKFGFTYLAYRVVRSILSAILAFVRLRLVYGLSRIVWGAGTLFGYLAAKP
jgi:glycosyltransferase involved in cell wall biosynthesis